MPKKDNQKNKSQQSQNSKKSVNPNQYPNSKEPGVHKNSAPIGGG